MTTVTDTGASAWVPSALGRRLRQSLRAAVNRCPVVLMSSPCLRDRCQTLATTLGYRSTDSERRDCWAVGVLGLLVADDDELVREARGRECDTVIDISEIIHGEVKEDSSTSWEKILVVAESVTLLRAVLPCLSSMTSRSRRFDLVVGGQPRPAALRLPAGPVGLRSINSADRRAFKHPQPHVRLTVEFKGHLPIGDALAAFLSGGTSAFRRPAGGLRVGFAHSAAKAMPWACGDPAARQLLGERPALESGQPSPVDLVVAAEPAKRRTGSVPVLDVIGAHHRPSWTDLLYASGADIETFITHSRSYSLVPPVDTDVLNPVGFLTEPERGAA